VYKCTRDSLLSSFVIPTKLSQNELLTYLWYLNLECIFKGLEVIQKFNNNDNDDDNW